MNKCVDKFAEGNPEEWEKMIRNNSRICFIILFLHSSFQIQISSKPDIAF